MARHATITATGLPVHFAHPHSPWERGSNENLNRIVREYFPKGTPISSDPKHLAMVACDINDRPRKIHNWKKPSELFTELVESNAFDWLHLPFSPGRPGTRRAVPRAGAPGDRVGGDVHAGPVAACVPRGRWPGRAAQAR